MRTERITGSLVLLVALVAAACGDGTSIEASESANRTASAADGQVVTSADGALTLEVPPGNPEVTIEPAEFDGELIDGVEVVAVYELGPDGSRFDEPVTATLTAPSPSDHYDVPLLAMALSDADGWSMPELTTIARTGNEVTVTAEIDHFSRMVLVEYEQGTLRVSPGETIGFIDQAFTVNWQLRAETIDLWEVDTERVATGTVSAGAAPMEPARPASAFLDEVDAQAQLLGSGEFVCDEAGAGTYGIVVEAVAGAFVIGEDPTEFPDFRVRVINDLGQATCSGEPPPVDLLAINSARCEAPDPVGTMVDAPCEDHPEVHITELEASCLDDDCSTGMVFRIGLAEPLLLDPTAIYQRVDLQLNVPSDNVTCFHGQQLGVPDSGCASHRTNQRLPDWEATWLYSPDDGTFSSTCADNGQELCGLGPIDPTDPTAVAESVTLFVSEFRQDGGAIGSIHVERAALDALLD